MKLKMNIIIVLIMLLIKKSYELENPKLSVIIPVYNSKRYLRKCLDSIIKQSYKNLEIICINDGSRDNSLQILKEYEKKDKRIKVFSQKNKGVSSARNKGIELSTGDYITFVDSDDFINLDAYKKSMDFLLKNNADVLSYDLKPLKKKGYRNKGRKMPRKVYVNDSISAMLNHQIYPSICNKIIKKKLVDDNKIRFKESLYFGEDDLFRLMSFFVAKKIALLPKVYYFYRRRRRSASRKMNPTKYLNNNIPRFKYLIEFFYQNKVYDKNDYLIGFALEITYRFVFKVKKKKRKFYANLILKTLENSLTKNWGKISKEKENQLKKLMQISGRNISIKTDL